MVVQRMRLVALLVLCALVARPADAQDKRRFKGSPQDFLPLEIGNRWTYRHGYFNDAYGNYKTFFDDGSNGGFHLMALLYDRLLMEIPGYPFTPDLIDTYSGVIPRNLRSSGVNGVELTFKITHTETIEGHEYFVFSEPLYGWPPVPTFCLAGQKVRFSDDGVLLVHQWGNDIPLYDFTRPYEFHVGRPFESDKEYVTPAYPVLYYGLEQGQLATSMRRFSLQADFFSTPPSADPAFITRFVVDAFGYVDFQANYGLSRYDITLFGYGWSPAFSNGLLPVSAVIGGEEIAYPAPTDYPGTYGRVSDEIGSQEPAFPERPESSDEAAVQPTSWGQVKVRHGQRP